jgi:hypothetical protein
MLPKVSQLLWRKTFTPPGAPVIGCANRSGQIRPNVIVPDLYFTAQIKHIHNKKVERTAALQARYLVRFHDAST